MSLPFNTPTEFTIAKVEVKKELPAQGDRGAATIFKLGLVAPDGSKGWAELFHRGAGGPTEGSKDTLTLEPPKQEGWLPSAKRPSRGGGFKGGRSPADTAAIQRQHSQEMAIRAVSILAQTESLDMERHIKDHIREWTDWFEADIANGGKAK